MPDIQEVDKVDFETWVSMRTPYQAVVEADGTLVIDLEYPDYLYIQVRVAPDHTTAYEIRAEDEFVHDPNLRTRFEDLPFLDVQNILWRLWFPEFVKKE